MCLVALALGCSARFPLVLASNRDEFFARPTAALDWWTPEGASEPILAGRDLEAGGTWLGLTRAGRLALVTNLRDPSRLRAGSPSRGALVPRWLAGDTAFEPFWRDLAGSGYNGFNLIAADAARGAWHWGGSADGASRPLTRGIYGVSNAVLDTPWPKLTQLKLRLQQALDASADVDVLSERLFEALADRTLAPDPGLPATGIPLELERQLSSAFIRTLDGRYGTRCSTLVISEVSGERRRTHVIERSYDDADAARAARHERLDDWPLAAVG